jgi:hypothetical protein
MNRLQVATLDIVALVGLVLVTIGAGMAWLPAAFLVSGALLLLYAIAASRGEAVP